MRPEQPHNIHPVQSGDIALFSFASERLDSFRVMSRARLREMINNRG
jgi:hypothetical protein